ncbi:MAG: phosphomannomutase / phosphoglucomutase [Candidatus Peregrinibacteria bacterium Greene0416_19]|nr:MAG: phosphomannomutase / phosphoglucomutase [Candidatus Peregrinibacteria bacterium Greene0416_19]
MISPVIFRAYDIRGKAYEQLTPDACRLIGQAFGNTLAEMYGIEHPSVVVGRDARTHGPELEAAVTDGLIAAGCRVLLMGRTPSPLNYFTICAKKLDGGVQVTASHNPKEDNGLKLQLRDAHAYSGDDLQSLRKRIESGSVMARPGGTTETIDAVEPYLAFIGKTFADAGRGKTVMVDGGNGVTGPVYCEGLRRAGCEVIELYTEPDGNFPNHPADPSKHETLKELQTMVTEKKADIGFGFDGDGDRVGVVDENGKIRTADEILLLLARDHLSRHPGAPVIFTVSNSGILQTEIEMWGGRPVMCKVGHSFVEHAMREHGAMLGGEQSGHFFCGEGYYGFDDALVVALRFLNALGGKHASDVMSDFPLVYQSPERRPHCSDDAKTDVIRKITEYFSKTHPVITLDGVRIDFGDGAWAGVRQSNTSPCLSICLEARSPEKLKEIEQIVLSHLKTYTDIRL